MNIAVHVERRQSCADMLRRGFAAAALTLAASVVAQTPGVQGGERSGKEVVEAVCSTCHKSGVNGAPRIGDKQAWAKLESRGLTGLTDSALKGIRKMPAHGGNLALTDTEIARAITYMVNQSGGRWIEPASKSAPVAERSGSQIVKMQCAKCHQSGLDGAPKIGDRAVWVPRLKQGLDAAVRSAIRGHGPMPARGGLADLTDTEIRAAIVFMVNQGVFATPGPSAERSARPDSNHKIIDTTEIYLGVKSAESIRAEHPRDDAESRMHGGIPSGKDYYHVNVSLFDTKTKAEITDAQVSVRVADPVMGGETKKLDLLAVNNAISFGNYFRIPGTSPYTITVQIRRPGKPRMIEAKFEFKNR